MTHVKPQVISEATLDVGQFLVLHIGDNYDGKTVKGQTVRTKDSEFWFFQVADRAELDREGIIPRDENGAERGPLGTRSGIEYGHLFDSNGDDILRVQNREWRVYHFSVGVQQDHVRIYPAVPGNELPQAFDYLGAKEPHPEDGDQFGFVSGDETDFTDPSVSLESVSWKNDARSNIQYGFFNESHTVDVRPILSIRGLAYELRPVVNDDEMLQLLADLQKPFSERQNDVRQVDFSRATLDAFTFDIPDEWSDVDNVLHVSQANLSEDIENVLEGRDDDSGSNGGGS